MTQPYYTAVPQVVTAGPVDTAAPAAAKLYTVVSGILGLVGIASTFGLVTQEQGANLGAVGTAATTLVGAVVTAIASFRTNKQLKNGTFEAAPPPVIVAPVDNALEQLTTLQTAVNDTVDKAQTRVADGLQLITAAASLLPGGKPADLGGVVGGVGGVFSGPLGDLLQDLADRRGKL